MRGAGAFGCLSVRLVHWFIENPDETLTTADVEAKFGVRATRNLGMLRPAVELGLLQRQCAGRGRLVTYTAGPKVRSMLAAGTARLADRA